MLKHFPKGHLCVGAAALFLTVFLLIPEGSAVPEPASKTISLPNPISQAATPQPSTTPDTPNQVMPAAAQPAAASTAQTRQPEPAPVDDSADWQTLTVKNGDNLTTLLKRIKLGAREVYQLDRAAKKAKSANFRKMLPGQKLAVLIDDQGTLQQLNHIKNRLERTEFTLAPKGTYQVEHIIRQPDASPTFAAGTINDSLFLSGQRAGMDDRLIMELANIFGWDIDFILDIREGDAFSVLYEEHFLDGEKIGNGAILAASFTNRGKTFRAVRYTNADGISHYFTPEGKSMRKEFLRTPVDFARISSHFNLRRKHPVLNRIRAHKGTDYAAPRGTPIKASGDGKVIHAGRKGGYGNVVIIQHGQKYKTLYAHLHKFRRGIRKGARVKQGQVIGYVGSTGLATGPHLHYEFYVNGAVRNPVRVKLPQANAIAKQELPTFKTQTTQWVDQLNRHQATTQVANADNQGRSVN